MKINTDNETIAENKVLILYILNTIEKPITNNALYELVISIQDINYFYFQQFILDLLENKYISELKEDERSELVYSITTVGKQTLELTKDMIPGIIKLKIDNTIKGELGEIEEEVSIISEFTPGNKDDFIVTCKIIENNRSIFQVSVSAASRDQAKYISDNWKENAINIYPKIMDLLTNPNID